MRESSRQLEMTKKKIILVITVVIGIPGILNPVLTKANQKPNLKYLILIISHDSKSGQTFRRSRIAITMNSLYYLKNQVLASTNNRDKY